MTAREEQVRKLTCDVLPYHWRANPPGGRCGCGHETALGRMTGEHVAEAVLDAILPVVTTVAELEALPNRTVVIDDRGNPWRRTDSDEMGSFCWTSFVWGAALSHSLAERGPLTVVWRP